MSFSMKKIFGAKEKTPLGFCDAPQMTVSEFFFGESPNYPKYHTTYRPLGHIHRVAAEGDAAQMEILLTLGQCNVYHRDRKDRTALHFACVYGRLPVVTILVKNNCEIDALDKNHTTPLMKSVQCWKQKCATVLLEHGADPNIRDSSGNSALHYAVYNGHEEMASLLLQYNADIEQKTKDGFTPLLLALREKRVELAEFLVRMGADIHVVDELQRNTLIYAIRCGSKDLSVLLLEKGIDFFYKDVFGWTALRYAIEGHCTFRQTLLDFEENLHCNKKDKEPELQVEPNTSCILAKQIDAGNDSLARISSCPNPETPVLTMKEDENSDARSNSESKPPNCAGNSLAAIDKIHGNRGKRTVEAWVEKDPSSESAAEVRDSVTNEAVERIKLLPSETELELMSVEDVSRESENDHPSRDSEHLPKIKVGHSSRSGYQMGKMNINRQMKEADEEYAQLMTPIETKDPVSKEPWTTKDAPTFTSEPDLEVTLKEDHNRFDDSRNIQSLRIREGPPNTSGNVSVAADPRRERTNRQAAESAKEYPPLMSTNKMKDSVPDKVITIKEVGIVQLEGPAVKLTSEREPNRQDGFKRNPPSNICKQIPAQDVGYLSIAKHQRGEKMVPSREKEFSKKCPQSKPTIVEEESVSKEAWDMTPVKAFLEDTSNDYPLSKPTVEKNDYVPNEVSDIKHGKWFQENCPKEYVQLKLPIEERDSFPREAPPVDQAKLHCADEPTSVKNSSRITRCVRQNAAVSAKATSVEDQKCPDDHEKNQRAAAFKRPQTKNIEYLSMATDKSRENFAEDQEEAEPITNISEGKQEWCDSRHTQRQGIGNLFLAEDQRCDSSIQDEEEDFPEEYVQLKPLDKEKTPFPRDAPAKKEVKTFGTEPDENLSSEEDQGWLDDCEEEHPKNVFKEPPPKDTVHLSMPKDEGGVNVIGVRCSQGKGFPAEYPELKVSIEKQDFVPTEDSILNQEKSFLAGPKPEQLRWEEEQTGWRGRDKKQRKQAIFERLQLKRNTRVSIDPPKSVRNTRAAEDRGATTVQPRPQEDQTGWHAIDKKPQKPVFVRVQRRWRARTSMEPEKSGEDTGAAQEKGATTVQPRPQEDWTGWHAIDKKPQKPIAERFQPRWNARVSLNPEESGENMGVAEEKGSTTVQPRPEENQMRWGGSEKMQWKPILERFQLKWSARVSVGPEKSRRHRGAGKDKVEPTVRVSSEQHSRCHSSVKKPQLHILERLQRKWSVRVCMETNQRKGKTKAAQMTYSSDEYPELKTATEKQDSVPVEDPEMNHEMSSTPETDLQVKSKEKKQTQAYENIQSVDIGQVSMTVGQRSKNTVSGEEEESDLNMTSGDELNRCYSSESNQSLVEEKMQKPESNGTDRDEYPSAAAASAAGVAGAAAGASVGAAAAGGSAVVIGGGAASGASGGAPPGVVGGAGGVAPAAGGSGTDGGVVGAGGNFVTAGAAAAAAPDAAPTAASAAAAATSTAAASAVASAMEELVLQRRSGEINNQRFLTKENARHDRPRKKTSKEKHKVTKQVRAVVDVTQLSESVSEDDSGRPFKKQGSLNSDHASIDLKKVNELPGKRNKKIETEKNDLKKEISETREEKSKLEDEVVQGDEEFWKLRFTLRKELEETKNIHCIYEIMKKHLNEKEDQHKERAAVAQLATHLRTRDRELRITRDTLKELQEAQDQHIDAIKLAQKMKDDLQRVEHENSELKVKVKEQAKKIEKLSRRLQNSRERLGQSSKLTQSGVRETLEVLCKNNVSPMNQIGVRIHSLRSEPSQRKTVQDPNTSSLKSYEQQCIEELRISNALLYGLYNLHRNKRLEESRTKVHITVEQDTSPLSTSETRFDLKSPCVACACPHPYVFPREAGVIPGNPRSSNYSSQRCHRTTEDEEKSFKELTELKQTLEYKLYHQKKKNDEIEKEIIGIKKRLKMTKTGHKIGECSSCGHSRTGQF